MTTPPGKYSKVCLTEEEQCEDLLLFLKLLSHLTTKDYLNFAPDDSNSAESQWKVEPVDVMVTGVSIVLPLMSEETLKVRGEGACRNVYFWVWHVRPSFRRGRGASAPPHPHPTPNEALDVS